MVRTSLKMTWKDSLGQMIVHLTLDNIDRAHKLDKPERGCLLLNHWSQRAVLLTEYEVGRGAKGKEVGTANVFSWPPLS